MTIITIELTSLRTWEALSETEVSTQPEITAFVPWQFRHGGSQIGLKKERRHCSSSSLIWSLQTEIVSDINTWSCLVAWEAVVRVKHTDPFSEGLCFMTPFWWLIVSNVHSLQRFSLRELIYITNERFSRAVQTVFYLFILAADKKKEKGLMLDLLPNFYILHILCYIKPIWYTHCFSDNINIFYFISVGFFFLQCLKICSMFYKMSTDLALAHKIWQSSKGQCWGLLLISHDFCHSCVEK